MRQHKLRPLAQPSDMAGGPVALRLTLALLMLAVTIVVVGRRVGWLTRLV